MVGRVTVGVAMPVHLYGHPANLDGHPATSAAGPGLWLLEDCAQAHGGRAGGRARCGTLGRAGCFSFYPSEEPHRRWATAALLVAGRRRRSPRGAAGICATTAGSTRTCTPGSASTCASTTSRPRSVACLLRRLDAMNDRRRALAAPLSRAGLAGLPLALPVGGGGAPATSTTCYVVRARAPRRALAAVPQGRGIATRHPLPGAVPSPARGGRFARAGPAPGRSAWSAKSSRCPCRPVTPDDEVDRVGRGVRVLRLESSGARGRERDDADGGDPAAGRGAAQRRSKILQLYPEGGLLHRRRHPAPRARGASCARPPRHCGHAAQPDLRSAGSRIAHVPLVAWPARLTSPVPGASARLIRAERST